MRKRLRKKWHRQWISDVRIEIAQNDQFVQLLVATPGSKIEINRDNARIWIEWDFVAREIIKRKLHFYVWIEPPSFDLLKSEFPDERFTFFLLEFCSVEFPSVKAWAGNGLQHFKDVAEKNQKLVIT